MALKKFFLTKYLMENFNSDNRKNSLVVEIMGHFYCETLQKSPQQKQTYPKVYDNNSNLPGDKVCTEGLIPITLLRRKFEEPEEIMCRIKTNSLFFAISNFSISHSFF